MKDKLISILLNSYFIAGVLSTGIIIFLPDYFSKYKVEKVSTDISGYKSNLVYYKDLDGDKISEKIISQPQIIPFSNASFLLFKSNGDLINQYNFDKPFAGEHNYLWFQDADRNGLNEIYFITRTSDSLFLNSQEPFGDGRMNRENIFIDTVVPYNNEYTVHIDNANRFSKIKTNQTDVVFTMNAGFSCYPRFAYKYDYRTNTILKSPYLTNSTGISERLNLDNDPELEFLTGSSAFSNDSVSKFTTKSDYSTWLTVLDDDLNFMFEPIEYKAKGGFQTHAIVNDSETRLFTLFVSREPTTIPSKLMEISVDGQILNEVSLQKNGLFTIYISINNIIVHNRLTAEILVFNTSLKQVDAIEIDPEISFFDVYDIDNDGFKEWIGFHFKTHIISIYRENFKHKVSFQFSDIREGLPINLGIKKTSKQEWQLYFQRDQTNTLFSYTQNPWYSLRFLVYLGIYLIVFAIVWGISKAQKILIERQQAIEREISELQIKTVKNQVDPHFVFNAINTISEMTLAENKIEADNFICRFSDFMRQTLQASDKITSSLKEELEYTENFIKLQKIRYNNSFDYNIQVDKSVNLDTLVPKHVLFTYTENAIKHGLAQSSNKGFLTIEAKKTLKGVLLAVEDNGEGINAYKIPKKESTGNGLLIMDKIFKLYSKLTNKKIKHQLIELNDASGEKLGVRVEIMITKKA